MKIYLKPGFTYVPDWNGNLELPIEEQISIEFEFLTPMVWEELMAIGDDTPEKKALRSKAEWLKVCKKINNAELDDGSLLTPEGLMENAAFLILYLRAKAAYHSESTIGSEAKKK